MNTNKLILIQKEDRSLYCKIGELEIEIHIKRCFPWSHPQEFLSLRDKDDNEVCLINSLEDLDQKDKNILLSYLNVMDFTIEIKDILNIEDEVELRTFSVNSKQGKRIFQTSLEDWPRVLDSGEILIEDLYGDKYLINNIEELNTFSRKLLNAYIA